MDTNSILASQNFFTDEQLVALLHDLKVMEMPDSEKENIVKKLIETVMRRILTRISHALVDDDMDQIEKLDVEDLSGNKVRDFLLTRIPNLDKIVQEEIKMFKEDITGTHLERMMMKH